MSRKVTAIAEGLGRVILGQEGANIAHAEGASYLGVVLEHCGYFFWNNHHKGIAWRLLDTDFSMETIISRLSQPKIGLRLETKTVEAARNGVTPTLHT